MCTFVHVCLLTQIQHCFIQLGFFRVELVGIALGNFTNGFNIVLQLLLCILFYFFLYTTIFLKFIYCVYIPPLPAKGTQGGKHINIIKIFQKQLKTITCSQPIISMLPGTVSFNHQMPG